MALVHLHQGDFILITAIHDYCHNMQVTPQYVYTVLLTAVQS